MRNFDVIFSRRCPCFASMLSEGLRTQRVNYSTVLLSDFVSSRIAFAFVIETFEHSGTILFTCFSHLVLIFAFDDTVCCHYQKRLFFTCKSGENGLLIRKCYRCYRKTVERLLYNFQLPVC